MDDSIEKKLEEIAEVSKNQDIEWAFDNKENKGIYIKNNNLDTKTFVTWDALEKNSVSTIFKQAAQGRDVDHITRVTGYFSVTSNWNKGKIAELKDRHRSEHIEI